MAPGTSSMLRTRRRDANVKPNRLLDRSASRGMIYENEELRLRTININAEVEKGTTFSQPHDLHSTGPNLKIAVVWLLVYTFKTTLCFFETIVGTQKVKFKGKNLKSNQMMI